MPTIFQRAMGAALLVAHLAHPVLAQSPAAAPDTLRLEAVLAELHTSPQLRAARLGASALATEAVVSDAWPDPSISLAIQPFPILTARGSQRLQFRVEQMLPWPGTLSRRRDVAEGNAAIANAEVDVFLADLSLQVQQAYIRLERVQAIDALIRGFQERLGTFAEAAAIRYEVGRGPQAAILRLQLESNRLETRLLGLDAERHLARSTLARLIDRPDLVADAVVVDPVALPVFDSVLVSFARRERPERDVLDARAQRHEAEIELAKRAFYPDIGASFTYFDIHADEALPTGDGRDALAIGLSIKIPLDRASRQSRLEAARMRAAQVEAQLEAFDAEIETQIEALRFAAAQERDQLALYRTRLHPQAQLTIESTLATYTTGQADFLTLLDAERARFELQIGEAEAEARYATIAAQLARALGLPSLYALSTTTYE